MQGWMERRRSCFPRNGSFSSLLASAATNRVNIRQAGLEVKGVPVAVVAAVVAAAAAAASARLLQGVDYLL